MNATAARYLRQLLEMTWLWRTALAASVIAILWLATSSLDQQLPSTGWDKANHFIAFLELTILARLGWPKVPLYWIALPLAAYGLGIETIQSQLPYREFSGLDLLADLAGIAAGLVPWPKVREFDSP